MVECDGTTWRVGAARAAGPCGRQAGDRFRRGALSGRRDALDAVGARRRALTISVGAGAERAAGRLRFEGFDASRTSSGWPGSSCGSPKIAAAARAGHVLPAQLVGCAVETTDGDGRRRDRGGRRPGGSLLVVDGERARVLIPLARRDLRRDRRGGEADPDRAAGRVAGTERSSTQPAVSSASELKPAYDRSAGSAGPTDEVRHRHDLSADGRGGPRGRGRQPGNRAGTARRRGARSAGLHDRSAPQRGRRAVRRRAGDGDEAGAAGAGGRGHPGARGATRTR